MSQTEKKVNSSGKEHKETLKGLRNFTEQYVKEEADNSEIVLMRKLMDDMSAY